LRTGIFFLFFLLISSAAAVAQQNSHLADKGSVYSQYGVGLPVQVGSSNAIGAGVWGVSDVEPLVPNLANPALWGYSIYGMASGGAQIDNLHAVDNIGAAHNTIFTVNHFQLQVPIKKNKLGLSISFTPYTRSSYKTFQNGLTVQNSVGPATGATFSAKNEGEGGINRFELGVGWKISKNISLGYAASIYHASLKNKLTAPPPNLSFNQVKSTVLTSGAGFGNRFGAYFTIPSIGGKQSSLSLGLVLNLPVTLTGEKNQQSKFAAGNPSQPNSSGERKLETGDIHLPLGFTGGITYKPSHIWAISAEGRFQRWSQYYNRLKQMPGSVTFRDRLKIGAGLQFNPVYSGSHKFLSQFKYRIGANYDTGYLKIRGEDINTLMITAGLGIFSPTKVQGFNSSIDLNFYYGIRGTKSQNLVKENIFGIKLTLNLAELFFYRPKLQ
jgi:hypothetical protein